MSKRLLLPLAASSLVLLAVSCSDVSGLNSGTDLNQQVCNDQDLGGQFREETAGDFSAGNLGGLADDSTERTKELNAAGLMGGHFAYWKHTVTDPPFDAPIEAVCQVMEFGSESQATSFVAALKATPDDLSTSAIVWLPNGERAVNEEATVGTGLPTAARAFQLTASGPHADAKLFVVFVPSGRFVRSVYVGDEEGSATLVLAASIQTRIQERLTATTARSRD